MNEIQNHSCCVLRNADYGDGFDWFAPIPELLHLEMNCARAFVSLNWSIFVEKVFKELGFTSDNALKYAKKCSDYHKLWQVLEIIYLAISQTLPIQ